jgi:hypothetical protein
VNYCGYVTNQAAQLVHKKKKKKIKLTIPQLLVLEGSKLRPREKTRLVLSFQLKQSMEGEVHM